MQFLVFYIYFNINISIVGSHTAWLHCIYLKLSFCKMARWRSEGPKHEAIKIRTTKYIVVFGGNYKQFVYFGILWPTDFKQRAAPFLNRCAQTFGWSYLNKLHKKYTLQKIFFHLITKANEMHYFSYLFHNVIYMFRAGPLSIIRSISTLYTRNCYLSC
jgi:hypothetical protein